MNEKIQAELFARLDAVAAKLGVGAEHLWELFVRQSFVNAVVGLLYILLASVAFGCASAWFKAIKANMRMDNASSEDSEMVTFCREGLTVLFVVCALIPVIVLLCNLQMIVSGFANPEYMAFKLLIKQIR